MTGWRTAAFLRGLPILGLTAGTLACAPKAGRGPISAPAPAKGGAPSVTAFIDVNVIPMDHERVLAHQTVVVQHGRITALGPSSQVVVPVAATRVDGRGKFLLPGLADMHTHISRYHPYSIDRIFLLLLANGVTTIRDVEFFPKASSAALRGVRKEGRTHEQVQTDLLPLRDEIHAGRRWGPRMYLASAWHLDSTKSIEQNLLAYKAAGYDFLKIYYDSPPEEDTLIAVAPRLGIPLVAHGVKGDFPASVKMRLKSFEHLVPYPMQTEDSVHLPDYAAATAREGIWNVPTVAPQIWYSGTTPGPLEARYRLLEYRLSYGFEPNMGVTSRSDSMPDTVNKDQRPSTRPLFRVIKALQDAGAGLLLGTDGGAGSIEPGFIVLRELQAFVAAGLTPYQALTTGTRNVAAYFGTLDSAGTVAVGKWADLLLLSANPLQDIRNAGEIAGVMAAGRWLSRADIETRLNQYYRHVMKPLKPQPVATLSSARSKPTQASPLLGR